MVTQTTSINHRTVKFGEWVFAWNWALARDNIGNEATVCAALFPGQLTKMYSVKHLVITYW